LPFDVVAELEGARFEVVVSCLGVVIVCCTTAVVVEDGGFLGGSVVGAAGVVELFTGSSFGGCTTCVVVGCA
jgi:hypothetical protein